MHNRIGGSLGEFANAITPDDILGEGGIADAMQLLVDKGLTRHIGFTSTGEADALHEITHSQRVGMMVIRVLAAGVIAIDVRTGKEGGVALANDVGSDVERMTNVLPLLKPEHRERAQVAVRYAMRNPDVSGIEVGMAELEHLEFWIGAAEMGPQPDGLLSEFDDLADANFGIS